MEKSNIQRIHELADQVIGGGTISFEDAEWLSAQGGDTEREALCEASHRITRSLARRDFDMCSIVNAKSGLCPENCSWCAQSSHHKTGIKVYGLISEEECLKCARESEAFGFRRFSIVTSGRKPNQQELGRICGMVKHLKENTGISLCASLGLLDKDSLVALKNSGVSRYHCNLETSASYFGKLCTTHTHHQKLETLCAAAEAGLETCSGGIIGMGESMKQRIELAFELRELNVESIPLNILHP
ncbi:MAG: biotin synthase BioB, partial [Bacteroidales bacterium]|nr:biotin synthase BioB [Bacteroidales bacterium]